jgi:uncharacterized membrane protein YoaK (UPF0700 family)
MTSSERTPSANRHLGLSLAFVAGAVNAGGFMVVGSYTSHMTGIVSGMADALALGNLSLVLLGLGSVVFFITGAAHSAMLINWGRRQRLQSEFALPLMLEAMLLLGFGLMGAQMGRWEWFAVPATVLLLCYVMGLQNAMVTKISKAEIRTTHVTGIVTDLGIELGKWFYWNRNRDGERVLANRAKMLLLASMLLMFFTGGVVGALSFAHVGFISTIPLAVVLLILAVVPVWDDIVSYWQA